MESLAKTEEQNSDVNPILSFVRKTVKAITYIEEFILSYSVIVMAVILIGNVISRSVLNRSWTFAEEIGQMLIIFMTFAGISYGAKKARHISMSAIFDIVGDRTQKVMILVISLGTSVVMVYLTYLSARYVLKVAQLGRVTPALRIPLQYIYFVVPLGFGLAAIQYFANFWMNIKNKEVYLSTEKGTRG